MKHEVKKLNTIRYFFKEEGKLNNKDKEKMCNSIGKVLSCMGNTHVGAKYVELTEPLFLETKVQGEELAIEIRGYWEKK